MKTTILSWASAAMLIFNVINLQAQTTWTVDNTPGSGAQFTDVQTAINTANNGDTIYVQQSTIVYNSFNINKSVHIIGRSYNDDLYETKISGGIRIEPSGSGSTIQGLEADVRSQNSGVNNITISECKLTFLSIAFGAGASVTASNWILEGNEIGVFGTGLGASNIIFKNNFFNLNGGFNIDAPAGILMTNNVFLVNFSGNFINRSTTNSDIFNLSDSIIILPGNTLTIQGNYQINNCLIYQIDNPSQNITISSAALIQNTSGLVLGQDPLFTIPFDSSNPNQIPDFTVLAGSPAIGAGIIGGDIGYESGFIFKRLGNPKGVPEVKINNYSSVGAQNGTIIFDIEARSH